MIVRIIFGLLLLAQAGALWNVGGGPLLAHLILTGCVFLMICVVMAPRKPLTVVHRWLFGVYGVFSVLYVLSVLYGVAPTYGLSEMLLFINSGLIILMLAGVAPSEKETRFFLYGVIALGLIESLVGVYWYVRSPLPRMLGTFGDINSPESAAFNAYANYLLLVLPVALWHFFRKHERKMSTFLSGLCASVIFTAFILTFSRAAWLSLILVGVLWMVWSIAAKPYPWDIVKKKLLRVVALIAGVVIVVLVVQYGRSVVYDATSLKDKLLFDADEGSSSATERLDYWHAATKIIYQRPLLGGGVLAFHYLYPPLQGKFGINEDHPHNFFLKIGVENGAPAAILITVFFVGTLVFSLMFFWQEERRKHVGVLLIFGALGAMAHNFLDYNFIASNFVLLAVYVGLCLGFAKHGSEPQFHRGRIFLAPLLLLSIGISAIGVHEAYYHRFFKEGRALLASGKNIEATEKFEQASPLLFPRDLLEYKSDTYEKQVELDKEFSILPTDILSDTFFDAGMAARAGEILLRQGKLEAARPYLEKALELDPSNTIRYYYLLTKLLIQYVPKAEYTAQFIARVNVLLDRYTIILTRNEHFTILTQNPAYASKLYDLLDLYGDEEAADKGKMFDAIWFHQMLLYSEKFGAEGLKKGAVSPSL